MREHLFCSGDTGQDTDARDERVAGQNTGEKQQLKEGQCCEVLQPGSDQFD